MHCTATGGKRRSRKGGDQEDADRCVRHGGEWRNGVCIGTERGGRRRKGHKKSRKLRGGMGYGAVGPLSVGAMEWGGSNTSLAYDSATGQVSQTQPGTDPRTNALVGGRRRKTRKGKSKKAGKRKSRRTRKMKGGGWNPGAVNAAGAGYGFSGTTSGVTGGIAPAAGYQSRVGGIPMGGDGVRSA